MVDSISRLFEMADSVASDPYGKAKSPQISAASSEGSGIVKTLQPKTQMLGRAAPIRDARLIRYDRVEARQKGVKQWWASKADRLAANDAGDLLERIFAAVGLKGAPPSTLEAFVDALCFAHTMNSASVVQPRRTRIEVEGVTPIGIGDILRILGDDARRFFRAMANETRRVNKKVLADVDKVDDIVAQEKWEWLMEVAHDRSLQRFPDLAHDSSHACWGLEEAERQAVDFSKVYTLDQSHNVVDEVALEVKPEVKGDSVYEAASRYGKRGA